jgi:hypothetical protein
METWFLLSLVYSLKSQAIEKIISTIIINVRQAQAYVCILNETTIYLNYKHANN